MSDLLLVPIAILYLMVVGLLFIYGINFFYLTYLSVRKGRSKVEPPAIAEWPSVTIQLPIYNEMYVAERLVEAVANLDYPADRLEIQVLDDSTDETVQIVRKAVEKVRLRGIKIAQVRRAQRKGFKAGALMEGFEIAHGEFLAIFDADFIPGPDFLKKSLPYFYLDDPTDKRPVAFVQTRWSHVNREYSFLTYLQSLAIDAHFIVEQFARSQGGYWFNFNGTAGIWRRAAVEAAGGWKADTLTEDLDLSYRAFLSGWRGVYLRDVQVPAELPVSFSAYRRQQHRWARGSLECAVKLMPQVWSAPISLPKKIEATLHLTGYGVHLLLFSLTILYPFVLLLTQRYPALISLFGIAVLFNATAFAPTIFFVSAQAELGRAWWKQIPIILFITALGAGMMLNTVRAAFQILTGSNFVFERTPKFGIAQKGQEWNRHLYQLKLDPLVFLEIGLAMVNAFTVRLAITSGNWVIAFYSALFLAGLLFASGLTIGQSISIARSQVDPAGEEI